VNAVMWQYMKLMYNIHEADKNQSICTASATPCSGETKSNCLTWFIACR